LNTIEAASLISAGRGLLACASLLLCQQQEPAASFAIIFTEALHRLTHTKQNNTRATYKKYTIK
jgi:hypothetical protein